MEVVYVRHKQPGHMTIETVRALLFIWLSFPERHEKRTD